MRRQGGEGKVERARAGRRDGMTRLGWKSCGELPPGIVEVRDVVWGDEVGVDVA